MTFESLEAKVKSCLLRHPDWDSARIAKATAAKKAFVEAARGFQPEVVKEKVVVEAQSYVTLDKIKSKFDTKMSILQEVSRLPQGRLISETEMCRRTAGTDRNRFRRTVENNDDLFRPLRVKLKLDDSTEGKYYWGHEEDVAEAVRIRDL